MIHIGSQTDAVSRFSCCHATFDITFNQGGLLDIADGGRFECNVVGDDDTNSRGNITRLSFAHHGILSVAKQAELVLGINRTHRGPQVAGLETPFEWNSMGSLMYGEGKVRLGNSSFAGPIRQLWIHDSSMTMVRLVELFLQRNYRAEQGE